MKELLEELDKENLALRLSLSMMIEKAKQAKLQAKLMKNRPLDYYANEIITMAEKGLGK